MAPSKSTSVKDRAFTGLGNLIKLLPTGTVFVYQFLSPLFTNNGHCTAHPINKILTAALVAVCGFSCAFSCFTDSYVDSDGQFHYGVATKTGLWPSSPPKDEDGGGSYALRVGDFVHAVVTVAVFGVLVLLDPNTVGCLFPALAVTQTVMMMVLPPVVGAIATAVFSVFPSTRHGIGYPPSPSPLDDGASTSL